MDINPFQIMKVRRAKRLWRLETLVIEIFWNFFFYVVLDASPSVPDNVCKVI